MENINNYRIIEKLASGGMGDIYLAEDTKLDRKVILKFLSGKFILDEKYRALLKKEARLSAGLSHPNIVTIHEYIEHKDQPIIVMEYVEGINLLEHFEEHKHSLIDIVNTTLQIASALSEAHSHGVIHKDIKSNNILITDDHKVKICDFGLATDINQEEPQLYSISSGTLFYMSPEQINNTKINHQTDLFSLGVVLYQLLTGQLPFTGDYEAAVKYSIVNDTPVPIGELNPDVDHRLIEIINKLLEKDINNRYQSADELIKDLREWKLSQSINKNISISKNKFKIILSIILIAVISISAYIAISYNNRYSADGKITIAVLPFENLGASDNDLFAEGMTDALTMNLAKINNIEVRSRNSAVLYKDSKLDNRTIGDQLNVRYLLTGRILWDNSTRGNVRISSSLVDIKRDAYLWTYQNDVKIERIFDVQTMIARDIVKSLPLALTQSDKDKLDELPTEKLDAYIFYVRAQDYFNRSWEENDVQTALDLFQKAVGVDSMFSTAYAMISRCYASLYWDHYNHDPEICEQSREYADKSMSFEYKPVEGYIALGYYYYHCEKDFDQALAIFNQGEATYSNNADLYNAIAAVERRQGKLNLALENFHRALELDPRSHLKTMDLALTFGMMRNHDSAYYYIDKTIELAPDYSLAHIFGAWLPIITKGDITAAKKRIDNGLRQANLKDSKYYWWLLRIIDPEKKLEYEYSKTPGTDSVSYYLHMAQKSRMNNNSKMERVYSDSSQVILKEKLKLNPNDARLNIAMAKTYAGLRNYDEAISFAQKAIALAQLGKEAMDAPFIVMDYAEILMIFDQKDEAVKQLKYLLSVPGFVTPVYLETDPLWKPLLDDPAYRAALLDATLN